MNPAQVGKMRTEVVEAAKGDEVVDMDIYMNMHIYTYMISYTYLCIYCT